MQSANYLDTRGEILDDTPLGINQVDPTSGLESGKKFKIDVEKLKQRQGALSLSDLSGKVYTEDVYIPKSVYRVLGDDYHPEFDPEYNARLLSREQTPGGKIVSFLNRSLIGEIMGGTIEGIGYLLDLPMIIDLAEGTEQEFGNAVTKFGRSMKTWAEETTPVFTDPDAKKFNPFSFEWWMSNGPSIFSTISLMIPSMAGMKAIQGVGKLLKFTDAVGDANKYSQWVKTGVGQAILSRHMENLMEASGVLEQGVDEAKTALYGKYKEQIEADIKGLPLVTPIDPELGPQAGQYTEDQYNSDINRIKNKWEFLIADEANKFAAIGASNSYTKQWILLLQDIPQYLLLNRMLRPGVKPIAQDITENSGKVAQRLGYDMPAFYASKTAKVIKDMAGEGLEEGYQFLVNEQSSHIIRNLNDPSKKSSTLDILKDHYDDGELWTNMFFGAIGAGFMQASMAGLNAKALAQSSKARVDNINSWAPLLNKLYSDYVAAEATGDEMHKEAARENFVAAVALRAKDFGNQDHLLNFLNALVEDDQNLLTNYEVSTEAREFFKGNNQMAEAITSSVDNIFKRYDEAMQWVNSLGIADSKLSIPLARSIAHSNHMLGFLNKKLAENESKLNSIEIEGYSKVTPEGESLSDVGKQIVFLRAKLDDIKRRVKSINKQLKSEKITDEEKQKLQKQKERLEKKHSGIVELGKRIKEEKPRTAEEKTIDSKLIGTDSKPGVIPRSEIENLTRLQETANSYEEEIEYFKEVLDEVRSQAESVAKNPPKKQDKKKPEESSDLDVGTLADYTALDGTKKRGIVQSIDYSEKDSEGNEQVPSAENADNIVTIQPVDENGNPVGELDHVTGIGVHPVETATQLEFDFGVAEDDLSDREEDIAPDGVLGPGDNLRDQHRRMTNTPERGLMEFLSYTQYETFDREQKRKLRKLEVRNKRLDKFVSDPANQELLKTGVASYGLDLRHADTADILKSLKLYKLIESGKKLTKDQIELLSKDRRFIDKAAVTVKLKIGTETFTDGLYLHTLSKTRATLKDPASIDKYLAIRKEIVSRLLRGEEVYTAGFETNRGNPTNIDKSNSPIARKNNISTVLGIDPDNLTLYVLKSSTKKSSAKEYEKPRLQKDANSIELIDFDFSSSGSVFVKTNKTVNGKPFAIKLNKSYVSKDHAFIIFNAFRILAKTDLQNVKRGREPKSGFIGQYNAQFDSIDTGKVDEKGKAIKESVAWNISVGELLDLLIVHGEELTDPDSSRYKYVNEKKSMSADHKNALREKRLFLKRQYNKNGELNVYLAYGISVPYNIETGTKGVTETVDYNRINLTEGDPNDSHFTKWIQNNKTYAVHLDNKMLGASLNGSFLQGRNFRIGKKGMLVRPKDVKGKQYQYPIENEIVREAGESYREFLIKNNIITTDIERVDGRLFTTPFMSLGLNTDTKSNFGLNPDLSQGVEVVEKEVPASPEEVEKPIVKAKRKKATKKETKSVRDIMHDDDSTTYLREKDRSIREPYDKQDLEKELVWVRKKLNIKADDVEIEKRLSNMMIEGKQAWGIYSSSGIILYEAAETGTIYHEAFHRVSLGYFTKEERERFYRAARQLYSMPKEKFSDKQVEEKLAEEFRIFVLSNQEESQPSSIKRVFKGIYEFFKALFFGRSRLTHSDVNRLFNQIYSGKYRFSRIRKENWGVEPRLRELMGHQFDSIESYKDITDITKYLTKKLIVLSNVHDLNDVSKISWDKLISNIEGVIVNLENKINDVDSTEAEKNAAFKSMSLLKDVLGTKDELGAYDKFPVFKYHITRFLRGMGILHREAENENESMYESSDYTYDIGDEMKSKRVDSAYGKPDYFTPLKDNALASVKFVINTLYEAENADERTGLIGFADGNKVWGKLLNDIIEYDNVDDMIYKIESLAVEQDFYPYIQLANILKNSSERFRTQFQTTFEAYKNNFLLVQFSRSKEGSISMEFDSASRDEFSRGVTKRWNEFMFNDRNIVTILEKKDDTGITRIKEINGEFFDKLADEYKSKVEEYYLSKRKTDDTVLSERELETIFNRISKILSKMHIDVSTSVIRRYAYNIDRKNTLHDNLSKLILIDMKNIISEDIMLDKGNFVNIISKGPVRSLAEAYADVNIHEESGMVLGPEGAGFYKFGKLNHLTDNLRRIKRSAAWAEEMLSMTYTKRSKLLKSFVPKDDTPEALELARSNRNAFELLTMSSFKSRTRGDKGREYLKLNEVEDYLFKAYAILNGELLPFPILANRSTYYLMKGAPILGITKGGYDNVIVSTKENGEVVFTEEVINTFYDYYLDEKERVDTAKRKFAEYKKDLAELNKELKNPESDKEAIRKRKSELKNQFIRDYHYAGNFNFSAGNAYNFIHFKGFESLKTPQEVKTKISAELNNRLQEELEFANLNNIINIDRNEDGSKLDLYAKLLDSSIVNNHKRLDMPDNFAVMSVMAKIMLNTQVAVMEAEKVFLGDPALFKRTNPQDENNSDTYEAMYKRWFGTASTGTRVRAKYPGRLSTYNVGIFNTQKFESKYYEPLVEKHTVFYEELLKSRLTEEELKDSKKLDEVAKDAKKLAESRLSKFKAVDPTDGSAFISPEMFKEINERLGIWTPKMQTAYDLLNSDKKLSSAEILKASNIVFTPLKTMYMGNHNFDGVNLLIYNKMAMFTLFRQHVNNTPLEEVLDRMETKGKYENKGLNKVHVYNFDSAVKVGGLNGINLFTNPTERNEVNDLSESFIFTQEFDNLRYQQVTEPHDSMKQTMGTAGYKIASSDIDLTKPYGEFATGKEMLNALTEARNAISNMGTHKVDAKFGISNGRINNRTFVEMLRRDAESANKSFDFVNSLRVNDETGEKYLELDAFNDRKWIYARIKTIVDSYTVDLNMPGNQLIQMTDYGMTNHDYSEELAFTRSKDKKTYEMEARVSIRLFKGFFPKNHEITQEDIINLLKTSPNIFGYRVPTQGQNSIVKLKIVGLLPEQAGDIIQLPLEFTALTGSDFDIDKLYVAMYNYEHQYDTSGKFKGIKKIDFSTKPEDTKERYTDKILELFDIYKHSLSSFRDVLSEEGDKLTPIVNKYLKHFKDFDVKVAQDVNEYENDLEYWNKKRDLTSTKLENEKRPQVRKNLELDLRYFDNKISEVQSKLSTYPQWAELRKAMNLTDIKTLESLFIKKGFLPSFEDFSKLSLSEQNTEVANQNRLLDIIFTVLSDDKHFVNITTPLGTMTDILEGRANKYDEIYSKGEMYNVPALYTTTPSFQSKIKSKFSSSTFGIAPYALSNNHISLTQMANVIMNSAIDLGFNKENEIALDRIVGEDNRYISWWISALIDAHVDGVNKPYITSLNINEATHDIVNFLIRAGLGDTTFDFVNQPVLRSYSFNYFKTARRNRRGNVISQIAEKDALEHTFNQYKEQLTTDGIFTETELSGSNFTDNLSIELPELLDKVQLFEDAKESKLKFKDRTKEHHIRQLSILQHTIDIKKDADHLRNFVLASRVDTKKYGSNPIEILFFLKGIENVIASGKFKNVEKILTIDPNYTYKEGDTFLPNLIKNSMHKIYSVLRYESIYATPGFQEIVKEIAGSSAGGDYNRMGLLNSIMEETVTYFMGKFFADPVNGLGMDFKKLAELIFELDGSLYETITQLKAGTHPLSKEVKNNAFLELLAIDYSDSIVKDKAGEGLAYTYIRPLLKSLREDMTTDELVSGANELISSEHEQLRKLGLDLYVYAFYTSALRNKMFSFTKALPLSLNREIEIDGHIVSWNNYLKGLMDKLNTEGGYLEFITEAKREVFTNMYDASDLVWRVEEEDVEQSYETKEGELFAIQVKFSNRTKPLFLGKNADKQNVFAPFIELDGDYFEFVGYDYMTNNMYYVATPKKGFGEKGISLHEYGIKTTVAGENRSILAHNNPLKTRYTHKQLLSVLESLLEVNEKNNFINLPLSNQIAIGDKTSAAFGEMDEARQLSEQQKEASLEDDAINKEQKSKRRLSETRTYKDEVAKGNEAMKANKNNKTTYDNPIVIDIDGSSRLSEDKTTRVLGVGGYAKFDGKEYFLRGNDTSIREFLKTQLGKKEKEVPINISNETAELFALLSVVDAFKNTSEHIYINQDYVTLLYFRQNAVNPEHARENYKGEYKADPSKPVMVFMIDAIRERIKSIEANGGSVRIRHVSSKTTQGNLMADKIAGGRHSLKDNQNDFRYEKWGKPTVSSEAVISSSTTTVSPYRTIRKIISGGQTGVDIAGLDVAIESGLQYGGTAAAGFIQSIGQDISGKELKKSNLALKQKYGLKEGESVIKGNKLGKWYKDVYTQRTEQNVKDSDGTIWIGKDSPGKIATFRAIKKHNKKSIENPTAEELAKWIIDNNIQVLNVAGNREWTNVGIGLETKTLLRSALRLLEKKDEVKPKGSTNMNREDAKDSKETTENCK